MSYAETKLSERELYALGYARLLLTAGVVTEELIDAMIGARKSLYLDALYSLEIDGWGNLAVDARGHALLTMKDD